MTKNPFINAIAAALYIVAIVFLMNHVSTLGEPDNKIFIPIAVLSLFTLSAAVMGYLFLYQPIQLYSSGDKKASLGLFLKTLLVFAVLTIAAILILFYRAA
ncbi:MAG TPA: hypothetical protein VJH71_02115 [Candidatus Paceibacterota bacterium]